MRALVERYEKQLVAVFPQDVAPPRSLTDVLDEMMANLMGFMAVKSGFEWMMSRGDLPGGAEADRNIHEQIVDWIAGMLVAQFPELRDDLRRLCAQSGYAIIAGLMALMPPPTTSRQLYSCLRPSLRYSVT